MVVRTRFAPSPTGYLHIGGVRTALFNWLLARQSGGQFLLRIDDTDSKRNVAEALQPILDGFRWLGLDWDEGPNAEGTESVGPHGSYFQSQRSELYQAAAEKLLAEGFAYKDYSTADEYREQREAAEKAKTNFIYDRMWMAESEEQAQKFESEGRSWVLRLKMPRDGKCVFEDAVCGKMEVNWSEEPDHVIQRGDGSCLYHLANVVDDFEMQITHVVRGIEHLSNTPRQIFIAQSLGYPLPNYAHLPSVAAPVGGKGGGKKKFSKREIPEYLKIEEFSQLNALGQSIAERANIETSADTFNPALTEFYEKIGFLPEAINNYLLLLGWSLDDSTEDFSREQMIQSFSLDRVNKAPASFDPAKLLAFQSRWFEKLTTEEKLDACLPFASQGGLICELDNANSKRLEEVIQAAGDRIKIAGDILDYADFFVSASALTYDEKPFEKRMVKDPEAVEHLKKYRKLLGELESFDAESTEQALLRYMESAGIKHKHIIHALRVSTTGKAVGFGMFETLEILGKAEVLARIDQSVARI